MWLSRLLCLVYLVSRICADEPGPTVQSKHSLPHPSVPEGAYSALFFKHPSISASNLILSSAKKDGADDSIAKYDGEWAVEVEETSVFTDDYTLVLKSKARHHAISWKLTNPIKFNTPEVVIQYEVKFANGMDCGGAYIKLLSSSPDLDLHNFNDKTPYTIMFGPDKCGLEHKFHFIIRHKNPKTGVFEEKHAKRVTADLEKYFTDKKTHLYTLVLRSDNSFERYIDQVKVQSGNLLTDLEPAINPPAEIDDPNDKRPADWDDREKIPDPNAQKPADWDEDAPELIVDESATRPEGWLEDEPEMVPDLAAEKPADWDNEMDGEWEPPMIKNPKCTDAPGCGPWTKPKIRNPNYKGKWTPPLIANPAYKGIWKPAKVPNPDYFQDDEPFKNLQPVAAVGLELWSMTENVVFDNFLIVDSLKKANEFAKQTWVVKSDAERVADPRAQSVVDAVREAYREKPLFVILIGVCCTIPFILCLWWVCRPSKQIPATMHKKTDAHTPDDTPTQYDSAHPERKTPTSDEGEEDGEGSEDDLVQVPDLTKTEAAPKKSRTKADLESDSDEVSTQEKELKEMTTEPVKTEKQAVRKRRSRKE